KNQFIYGGQAFFDNMENFFSKNGFEVLDQDSFEKNEIHFSNAWGVCDEDLFDFALKKADQAQGPFFQFILTTSNHRPYTYPEGKIDIPSHTGRDGAVKYADFAIGEFIKQAQTKPWFKNTIFIFVADHNASVAGGVEIHPYDYRIPMIFYSPDNLEAKNVSVLGSQIDLAPTLFGLLNFSYQSRFFGHDLNRSLTERAFLATYQKVGMWKNNEMILLSPNRQVEVFSMNGETPALLKRFHAQQGERLDDSSIEETVAYYEAASDWFGDQLLKEKKKFDLSINRREF
ncbi:MAG: LTA synthase family protein, partial [Bdellovibrionales bacterium]|nr:LTA synthase family protein [Bdellovibrionales bacterium]